MREIFFVGIFSFICLFSGLFGEESSDIESKDGLDIFWEATDNAQNQWNVSLRFENNNAYPIKVSYQEITIHFGEQKQEKIAGATFSIEANTYNTSDSLTFSQKPVSIGISGLTVLVPVSI